MAGGVPRGWGFVLFRFPLAVSYMIARRMIARSRRRKPRAFARLGFLAPKSLSHASPRIPTSTTPLVATSTVDRPRRRTTHVELSRSTACSGVFASPGSKPRWDPILCGSVRVRRPQTSRTCAMPARTAEVRSAAALHACSSGPRVASRPIERPSRGLKSGKRASMVIIIMEFCRRTALLGTDALLTASCSQIAPGAWTRHSAHWRWSRR